MKFLCHMWNHTEMGKRSLEDVVGIMGHQLRALGHWIIWDPDNDRSENIKFIVGPDQYNIIVEGFTPTIIEMIARARRETGAKFICLATEEPTPKGFNHGTQREMVWRQDIFPEAMKHFEGIMHLVPGDYVHGWYSQHAPTAYVELGYAPSLKRRETQMEPPYEFGFYGSVTPRRLSLLKRLAKRSGKANAIRVVADFATQVERDRAMQEAKVILQIRKFDEMGLVSSSRCNTALCCGRPVVAEPGHDIALSKPWDEIVKFASTEDEFFQVALLTAKHWRGTHAAQFKRFTERLSPEACVGRALHQLGLSSDEGGLAAA